MATSLGEAVLELFADDKELQKSLQAAGKNAQATLNKVGGKLKGVGKTMTAAVTLPILGIGVATINMASDMEESRSKVRVVFGDSAAAVEDFAKSAATNLGMSENAALAATGTYGNLFTSMGMSKEASADMSTSLVTLAGDLASFNNMDPTEVLDKLRAGLTGETEPLKSLGVNLNQASIEAKAMELGLVGANGELTAAAKAQASYALIMEQTTNAQGDFARTSDGLANSMRITKAELADAGAKIGQMLLPYALQAVEVIRNLVTWFTNLSPGVMTVILVVAGLAAAIGPLIFIVGTLMTTFTTIMPVITAISGAVGGMLLPIAAVIAVIALLAAAWKGNWGGIRDTVIDIWETKLKPIFESLKEWLGVVIPQAIEILKGFWVDTLQPAIQSVSDWVQTVLFPILGVMLNWLADKLTAGLEKLGQFWTTTLLPAIEKVWGWISTTLLPLFSTLWTWLGDTLTAALEKLGSFWETVLLPAITAVWDFITADLVPLFEALWELLEVAGKLALEVLAGVWENTLKPALKTVWEFIQNSVIPIMEELWDFLSATLGPVIQGLADGALVSIKNAFQDVRDAVQWVIDKVVALTEKLKGVKLPKDWTPGSPTPAEIGFRGVADALNDLSKVSLPNFISSLDLTGKMGLVGVGSELSGGRMAPNITYQYNLQASYGYQSEATLIDQVKMLSLLGGA